MGFEKSHLTVKWPFIDLKVMDQGHHDPTYFLVNPNTKSKVQVPIKNISRDFEMCLKHISQIGVHLEILSRTTRKVSSNRGNYFTFDYWKYWKTCSNITFKKLVKIGFLKHYQIRYLTSEQLGLQISFHFESIEVFAIY